ncbi:MAG: hypothetical protein JNJ61_26975 [Anaerolineae bacterium]|nr:hypothetical protein [Anaerolineae bacterium]
MDNQNQRRVGEFVVGLVLILMGLAAFAESFLPALFILGLGAFMLYRQWGGEFRFDFEGFLDSINAPRESAPRRARYAEPEEYEPERQTGAEKVYAHALRAVERAGFSPDEVRVLPVDLGLMVFRTDQDPIVYRTQPVPDDADYVQPFVQLRLPTKAVGRVKFEIIDSDGQVLFIHEDIHQFERGRNLITPSARLPVHDAQAMHRNWQLRISADGTVLANHHFTWQESDTRRVRRHVREDGEISNELRATLEENRLHKLSLDELLAFQDEDDEAARQRR